MAVWKFHSPFLDDVRTKGLGPALYFKVNETVERVTAGMDIEDIRSMLRGDPAPRPNPRVRPHADGFWLHMRPTYYHNLVTGVYPSFRMGWLSTYFFAFEIITGLFLMIFYTPSPLVAYENMLNILSNVPFGRLMRDLHKLGAEMMVIVVLLHMVRTFVTGSYKKPRQFTWFTGVILLLVTLVLSFSGYLLPWDQLALWAVTIGASMVEAVQPQAVGDFLNLLVRGGPQFNEGGLLRWYLLHILLLPLIGIVFTGVHYYKVVLHGHGLPPEVEPVGEDTAKRVPMDQRTYFMPDILTRELLLVCVVTAGMIFAAVFFYHAPLEPHADPLVTPLHTTAPWYFLWIQGMLKIGDKFIWGVVMPGVMFGILFVLPYLEVGPSRRYGDRRVGLTFLSLSVALMAMLSYMGTPRYGVPASLNVEIVAELVPQTHPGPFRQGSWADYQVGAVTDTNPTGRVVYAAAEYDSAPTPTLRRLLEEMQHGVEHAIHRYEGQYPDGLKDARGYIIIEESQPGLKRIVFRVVWDPDDVYITDARAFSTGPLTAPDNENPCPGYPPTPAQGEYCVSTYLHEDSNFRQGP
jgi:quinol-cytochrome oxidoreductase complex cytochrome b subunit